jgi:hypothetical protein
MWPVIELPNFTYSVHFQALFQLTHAPKHAYHGGVGGGGWLHARLQHVRVHAERTFKLPRLAARADNSVVSARLSMKTLCETDLAQYTNDQ